MTATRHLAEAGVASPRVDAELLAAHVLGADRSRLLTGPGFTAVQKAKFLDLVRRRAGHEPLQHLLGSAGFHRLDLAVGPGVFIPRPETELLVEWGLAAIREVPRPLVVDLCAGSGAIGLAVAHERPDARVYAVERDPAALRWLHRNAAAQQRAGDPPIAVVAGDAVDPAVLSGLDGRVDLVLANPPYIPEGAALPPDVADHDPGHALYAGADGLAVIRPLAARAIGLLRPGGWLGIEHDDSHGAAAPEVLAGHPELASIVDHPDLADRPRFVTARRA